MQGVLKFLLIAISAAVIGYVGWTMYGEGTKTANARMSESVHLSQAQAQNTNQSLTEAGVVVQVGQSVLSQGTVPPAMETPPRVVEITSLDNLLIEWKPRYEAATRSYTRFDASITNAKSRAEQYFAQQQAITDEVQDPTTRARLQEEDEADMVLYLEWKAQADSALKEASRFMIQLDDMDAILRKMELRADFVFDSTAFTEVPAAISELNQQLFEFQVASENIKLATRSPFEAQQP